MNIGSYVLTADEERKVMAIFETFKAAFDNCKFSSRESILGIGEPDKHLMCYFRHGNGNVVVKFKNAQEPVSLNDTESIDENIASTIELFRNNSFYLKRNPATAAVGKSATETESLLTLKLQISNCIAHITPENGGVSFASCSNRLKNVLYRNSIVTLNDLKRYSPDEIFKFKNFGEKCLWELCMFLTNQTADGAAEQVGRDDQFTRTYQMLHYIEGVNAMDVSFSPTDAFETYLENQAAYSSIYTGYIDYLSRISLRKLTVREQGIFNARLGINETPKTLQEIGDSYNLTRERIRQIVNKTVKKLKPKRKLKIDNIELEYARCRIVESCISASFNGFVAYLYFESENVNQFKLLYTLLFNQPIDIESVKTELESQYWQYTNKVKTEQKQQQFNEGIYQLISYQSKREITDEDFAQLKTERTVNTADTALANFSFDGVNYQCESFLEKKILEGFLRNKTFKQIKTQALKIPFKNTFYHPDFQCLTHDNNLVLIEVKPLFKMCEAHNVEKFLTMKQYCEKHGFGYLVIDDRRHSFFTIDQTNESFEQLLLAELSARPIDFARYKEIYDETSATASNLLTCIKKYSLKLSFPFALTR